MTVFKLLPSTHHLVAITIPKIIPYNAIASAKIKINNIPTNNFSYLLIPLTATSPTTPIAQPDTRQERPHERPLAMCLYPSYQV